MMAGASSLNLAQELILRIKASRTNKDRQKDRSLIPDATVEVPSRPGLHIPALHLLKKTVNSMLVCSYFGVFSYMRPNLSSICLKPVAHKVLLLYLEA